MSTSKKISIEKKYQQKNPRQHIMDRPHNYIGSMELTEYPNTFILNDEKTCMIQKTVSYVPAFLKIFDEILSNSTDHFIREKNVTTVKVNVDISQNKISVYNDGPGIEVILHKEKKIYIPEFIFGQIFTSSNYDDTQEREWVGVNGLGSKATNIFSKKFIVETVDADRKKLYYQEFSNNMTEISIPIIKECSKSPYTKITFFPDLEKFSMKKIDTDTFKVMEKRVYDASATINSKNKKLKLYFNETLIPIKKFEDYARLYPSSGPLLVDNLDTKNWQIILTKSCSDEFNQISFVNSIPTYRGGKHVDLITNHIVKKVTDAIKSKHKDLDIKPTFIKNKIMLFLNISIKNAKFDSQTKDFLITPIKDFEEKPEISDKIIKSFTKEISEEIINLTKARDLIKLNKEVSSKSRRLNIPKLDDANLAGSAKSNQCALILTEGDSAKSGVLGGLPSKSKDFIGLFPLKGKVLNVQEATIKQLENNQEIKNIMMILGLQKGEKYINTDKLRYGKVFICADQDVDGIHITSLILNFFRTWFPELLKLEFISSIKTPLVRVDATVKHKKETLFFYNISDFDQWRKSNPDVKYKTEYKKGLGSLTKDETKLFFSDVYNNKMTFELDSKGLESIDLAFSKKNADNRKHWLSHYNPNDSLDYNQDKTKITDFVNKGLKHFSTYDNIRSIPNLLDGLKPSQRKILYCCFKRNLSEPVKVAQLSGYISEHAEYHHGEMSLQGAIIGMAQDFVGSNNINLLYPKGQFGSRLLAGQDAASPRYIHTKLSKITSSIFNHQDFQLLKPTIGDEGDAIEPEYYVPVIPMILVNGAKGIGTGYSTTISCHNPLDIIEYIENILKHGKFTSRNINPWYNKFKGMIIKLSDTKFETRGVYTKISSNKLKITELPIGRWTENYKETLNSLIEGGLLKNFKNNCTDEIIDFEVTFKEEDVMDSLISSGNIYNQLDLTTLINNSNMHLFTPEHKIKKYEDVYEIIKDYYEFRLKFYDDRKKYMLEKLNLVMKILNNKIRFITEIMEETLKVFRTKRKDIIDQLIKNKYDQENDSYEYLLKLNVDIFTYEEIDKLQKKIDKTKIEILELESSTSKQLWLNDLDEVKKNLKE